MELGEALDWGPEARFCFLNESETYSITAARNVRVLLTVYVLTQVGSLRRVDRNIHLLLLHLLLPREIGYVGLHANLVLLRLHDLCLLRLLPHAGHRRFPRVPALRPPHLPFDQVRVKIRQIGLLSSSAQSKCTNLKISRLQKKQKQILAFGFGYSLYY